MNSWISTNGHFQKSRENHIKDEFVKIQEFTLVIIFVISPQKWLSRLENQNSEISRNSAFESLWLIADESSLMNRYLKWFIHGKTVFDRYCLCLSQSSKQYLTEVQSHDWFFWLPKESKRKTKVPIKHL